MTASDDSGREIARVAAICDAATPDEDGVPGIDFLPACAAEAVSSIPVLKRRCVGCAYTIGTEANTTPSTARAAKECVERSHPFWCHLAEDELGEKTHLCAGWIERLAVRVHLLKGTDA